MSTMGKLSSYFTKRREVTSSRACPEELGSSSSGSVRARLEKKLQVKQKTGFAFNFAVDSDADEQQEGGGQEEGDACERGSFCFNFNPTDASDVPTRVPEGKGRRRSSDASSLRAAQDFLIGVEKSGAQPSGHKKRKGAGKKKKKKKKGGKGEVQQPREQRCQDPVGEGPEQEIVVDSPTISSHGTVVDGGGEATSSVVVALPAAAASDSSPKREHKQRPPGLRPPPGFTLESWKDPAITGEERRRRRFGSGVRNMVAIQRSCDARRGFVADGEVREETLPERQGEGLGRPGCDRARGMVGAGAPGSATSGGSSVFAFGFDIGISFDGGC
ncbi:unnamed protein product [Ectocarpus fasciculatus]